MLRLTLTRPGVATRQVPRPLESVQAALTPGIVLMAMVSDDPFAMDAQPDKATASAAVTAIVPIFIKAPQPFEP